jgi:hypothetical protein
MSPDDKGAPLDVQELVTRPLPAGEEEEALAFFKGGGEELVLLLGRISDAHHAEHDVNDKRARAPVEDLCPVEAQVLVTRTLSLVTGCSALWVVEIKPLKLLWVFKIKEDCHSSFNLDAFEMRKDVTSVSLPKAQVLVTRPPAPAGYDEEGARALVEDLTPVDVQVLDTRPLAPAGEENEAPASLEEEKEALTSLKDLKDARAAVEDLIPVDVQALEEDVANLRLARLRGLQHWLDVIISNVLVKVKNSLNVIILNMTLKEILSKSDKVKETCTLRPEKFPHPILLAHPYIYY